MAEANYHVNGDQHTLLPTAHIEKINNSRESLQFINELVIVVGVASQVIPYEGVRGIGIIAVLGMVEVVVR